jgi:hypothetical protein
MVVGCLVAIGSTCATAAQTTISINATIIEVQCTAEQRTRIRACAAGQENYTTEPAKTVVGVPSAGGAAQTPVTTYEIQPDPARPVIIRTVLY